MRLPTDGIQAPSLFPRCCRRTSLRPRSGETTYRPVPPLSHNQRAGGRTGSAAHHSNHAQHPLDQCGRSMKFAWGWVSEGNSPPFSRATETSTASTAPLTCCALPLRLSSQVKFETASSTMMLLSSAESCWLPGRSGRLFELSMGMLVESLEPIFLNFLDRTRIRELAIR